MKLRLLLGVVFAALLATSAPASYYDFEQITVAATAIGFTATKITPAGNPPMTLADCRVRTAEISALWVDPAITVVTASVGQLLQPGDRVVITGREELVNFRAIRTGSTSGQLDCIYRASN